MPLPTTETLLHLPGPAGTLETLIVPHSSSTHVAIICHPHPLHGGTMHNKVVTITAKAFQQKGFTTLRFNYRGVGASTGQYGHFVGETADLLAIMGWVRAHLPTARLGLAGFSFGAYIAAQGALQQGQWVQQLIMLAPAVNRAAFADFTAITCPWVVIQGMADEIVPPAEVYAWVKKMNHSVPIKLVKIPDCSHFFHGKLVELRDILTNEILL